MEYELLKIASPSVMENAINERLADGWECCGGISIGDGYMVQGMIRKKK